MNLVHVCMNIFTSVHIYINTYICIYAGMAASHPYRVFLYLSSTGGLPPNETTIAEVAKAVGYSTAVIGTPHH